MSVTDIFIRSVSGYVFVIPEILLYFLYLKKSGKRQSPAHITFVFLFCYYLIGIFTMTGIGKLKPFSPRVVLIPFLDMISGPIDTLLNIALFIPLGFFLPLLYQKYSRIGSVIVTALLFSLSIEVVQMFGRGTTDINDLITNMVGAGLGYFIYNMLSGLMSKKLRQTFWAGKIHDRFEVCFFMACSFVIMITIQPLVISRLFRLG